MRTMKDEDDEYQWEAPVIELLYGSFDVDFIRRRAALTVYVICEPNWLPTLVADILRE